jgi:5-methylcytosine-specific restriction endonuclease McrA
MRRSILLALLAALFLAACSGPGTPASTYVPEDSDIDLSEWAERYPAEYADWEQSVHGQAYLSGDTDAPACTDCHADPDSGEIQTAAFRLDIPNRCARCHVDESLMAVHDVPTDVYSTYVADYHGTTINYYHVTSPDTWRYEAVCSDCHNSHAILPPDDPESSVAPANLTETCSKCHHDAPEAFATAYGHYRPIRTPVSSADSPITFWVKLFYQALIPVILGCMVIFIAVDLRYRSKRKSEKHDN